MSASNPEQVRLTAEQITNWRNALVQLLGPYALIMPVEQVHTLRDKFQNDLSRIAGGPSGR